MEKSNMMPSVKEVLLSSEDIKEKVREIGERITEDYRGQRLLLVGILRGAVVFLSDLMRHLQLPCEIDFMEVSSYGADTTSSGVVRILKDLEEDIMDTGITLSYLRRSLLTRKPASLEICALLSKPSRRKLDLDVKYVGFEVPDEFVVGYGIDFAGAYRNLSDIHALKPEDGKQPSLPTFLSGTDEDM